MTLEQLRIFVEVAQRQHLTRAAAALFLTPSAVSASIKTLEERYGTSLFNRVGRRIELSETGKIFLADAQRTLASARAAEATLAELGALQRGSVAIHASQTIASYWLPPLLVAFQRSYPAIALHMEVGNSESVAQAVMQGEADLGFVEGDVDAQGLTTEAVAQDRLVVVVDPAHPWADGRALGPAELSAMRWILREPGSGTRSVFEHALAALGVPPAALQVALSLPSNEAVRSAIVGSPFSAAMSSLVVASDLRVGLLAQASLQLPVRSFSLLRHPERRPSRAAAAFAASVQGVVAR
jgi:DNA-binding transcriptional LysR family regulator